MKSLTRVPSFHLEHELIRRAHERTAVEIIRLEAQIQLMREKQARRTDAMIHLVEVVRPKELVK